MNDFIEYYSDHVRVREATKQGYTIARGGDSINLEQPNSKTRLLKEYVLYEWSIFK